MIYEVLDEAILQGASDVHLTVDVPPALRVDGRLIRLDANFPILNADMLKNMLYKILSDEQIQVFKKEKNLDTSISYNTQRLRVHVYMQMGAVAFAIRLINIDVPELNDLNLPSSIMKLTRIKDGLVLVTGVTGSGKSTTLAAILNEINKSQSKHIVTVEDPIEYIHEHQKSIVNQREIGKDVHNFSDAVKYAMREDPDILLLGELRDLETIKNAITMAETGHLVLATLHTRSVAESPDRIIDVFPAEQQSQIRVQLANSLKAIIAQELIPRNGGGRIASCEIMFVNDAIRNIIKKQGNVNEIIDTINANSKLDGSQTRVQSLAALYMTGLITKDTALENLNEKELSSFIRIIRQ